ncbi:hypothetical protein [Hahella ganghwensis]|uniref:hypothetical protein n=1 Tax=Hahella ganghwensis TaxID=286420 RepID=UPI000360CAA0|nr:hypothetical protein [Hahella ganghwensis]
MRFAVLITVFTLLSGCLTAPGIVRTQSPTTLTPLDDQRAWIVGSLSTAPDVSNVNASLLLKNQASIGLEESAENSFSLSFDWGTLGMMPELQFWKGGEDNAPEKTTPYDSLFLMEIVPGQYFLADIEVYAHPYTTRALNDYYIPLKFAPGTVTYLGAFTMEMLSSGRIRTAQLAIKERYEFDVSELRAMYPQLQGKEVINGTLPITYISPFVVRY